MEATVALVYDRPLAELETALRDRLAIDSDPVSRSIVAGAAYAAYPELVRYLDAAVAELEVMPRTGTIDRALEAAARVRRRVEGVE